MTTLADAIQTAVYDLTKLNLSEREVAAIVQTASEWYDVDRLRRVEQHAKTVMALLDQYGASIVGHLIDNDDNPGEYLRQALNEDSARGEANAK